MTGEWLLKDLYRVGYFPIALGVVILGVFGDCRGPKRSTAGEGRERRYFYSAVWAVAVAQPTLWALWKWLPQTRTADVIKLVVFVGVLSVLAPSHTSACCPERGSSSRTPTPGSREDRRRQEGALMSRGEGWSGWDQYAPFYDWENAQNAGPS